MNIGEENLLKNPPSSFWIKSVDGPTYLPLNKDLSCDIAIVGGGMAGLLTAYFLTLEGAKVVLLEADRILAGTTGHTTAKITSLHGLIYSKIKSGMSHEFAQQYAEANEYAIRMIQTIAEENKIDCDYLPQSSYVYTQKDEFIEKISDETKAAQSLKIEAAYLEQLPLPFAVKAAVRFDGQAQFHPRKFLFPLAEKMTQNGCQIFEESRVTDLEDGTEYKLTTEHGNKVTAKKVVIASHYPFFNKIGYYFTKLYTERSYVLAIQAKEPYPGGMYINAEEPARSLRSQISERGNLILVGGEHHKTGQSKDTRKHYHALWDFAAEYFTIEEVPYHWSTQDCMTLDSLPYVGYFQQDTPNLYLATGFGKWGMTNSMASAILIKDLITKGNSPWQDVYNPSRHTVMASAKNFIVENLNVAKELIEGKISSIPSDTEIRPGEGKVISAKGQRAGAFMDEQGKLHVVDTTCTHMGCELHWNSAETTWDCPCHGSRFDFEGDIVEGPAIRPLAFHKDVNTLEKLLKDEF